MTLSDLRHCLTDSPMLRTAMGVFNGFHCVGVFVSQVYREMYLYATSTYEYHLVLFF